MSDQPPVDPPARPRLYALDALRGIAALTVAVYHPILRYPRFMLGLQMDATPLLPGLTQADVGAVPVLWFFLISGFVITWTVDRCRTPMDFVISRVSRLYPTYWAAVTVAAVLSWFWPLPGMEVTAVQVAVNATMLQHVFGVPDVDGAFWSLAIELVFYAHALALFALGLWPRVHQVALAWAALCLAAVLWTKAGGEVPWRADQVLNLTYGPYLAAGMMLYRTWRGQHRAWTVVTLALCAVAIVLTLAPVPAALCALVASAVLLGARGRLAWLAAPPLVWLGSISYALYVSHQVLSFTLVRALDARGLPHGVSIAMAVGMTLLLATAITNWVERPAMRTIRDSWRVLRSRPVGA